MNKVLIYGGAFDPPHYGHLAVAHEALKVMAHKGYTSLWYMPCASDAFGLKELSGGSHRVAMLEELDGADPRTSVSTFELDMNNQAGTYALMRALIRAYPGFSFAYVIGQDQARLIKRWRNSRALRKLVPFVTIKRHGDPPFQWGIGWASEGHHTYVKDSPIKRTMASVCIRKAITSGNKKYLRDTQTSPAIMQYIRSNNLYRKGK